MSSSERYERYVAIGDSSTEGLEDPDGSGGYRGWADRLAERLAAGQGSLLYANLAVRGRLTREVLSSQLDTAVSMRPDLASVFSGTNDVVRPRFDAEQVARDVERMQRALVGVGARVITFTLPDLAPVLPLARVLSGRIADLNAGLARASSRSGALLVDVGRHAVTSDPRLWNEDRFHANALGHERIAHALAHALGLADASWVEPLPGTEEVSALGAFGRELRWWGGFFVPWLARHALGRSSGDGRAPKRPELLPLVARTGSY